MPPTASHFHQTSSRAGRHRRTASTPTPYDVARSHPARSSLSLIRLRSDRVFTEHNGAHLLPLTARPPWLAVPRAGGSRPSGSRRPVDPPTSLSVSALAHSRPSVLVVITSSSVTRFASSFGTRSRDAERIAMPRFTAPAVSGFAPSDQRAFKGARWPFPRASAATAILDPPRFHSAGLTPACSGLASLATDARR